MANLPVQSTASSAPSTSGKLDQRLKEVHATDLTEGRINQDFVDWMKSKGMTYLLVVLMGLCAYLVWVRWQNSRSAYQAGAWKELAAAALPTSLEEVAVRYSDVGAVPSLARLNAAAELMRSVQMGKTLGADEATRTDLSEKDRAEYLDRADRLYREIVESDDKSAGKTLMTVTALTGRAVAAESRGESDKAREFYLAAADRAGKDYPELAEQARKRAEVAGSFPAPAASMPSEEQVKALAPKPPADGVASPQMENWIRELIDGSKPEAAPAGGGG